MCHKSDLEIYMCQCSNPQNLDEACNRCQSEYNKYLDELIDRHIQGIDYENEQLERNWEFNIEGFKKSG